MFYPNGTSAYSYSMVIYPVNGDILGDIAWIPKGYHQHCDLDLSEHGICPQFMSEPMGL